FHCFSEDYESAAKVLDLGFYIGVGGVLTYKKSLLPEVVTKVPLESILLETDSPYLAPVPFRGKRNESSYVSHVATRLAELVGVDYEEVCGITTQNAKKLFSLVVE
ncbi:MAG: TatD family hydrolase, partial [Bacteroidales bacterium]|nr:TatD family hydrolase [Bacteroidales bacterium]